MPVYAGATAPSAFKVGSTDCSAIYVGSTLVWSAVAAPTTQAYYSDTFTTLSPAWKKIGPNGTVSVVSGKMVVNPNTTAAYTGGVGVYLGDGANLGGNATTGAPMVTSDIDMTFDISLVNLLEQYPLIALRVQGTPDLWVGGNGDGSPKTGYLIILEPSASQIEFQQGYTAGTTDSTTPFTFPSKDMTLRILAKGKRLAIKAWVQGATEPGGVGSDTNWGYNNLTHMFNQASGLVVFTASNGGQTGTNNQQAKTVSIDNFTSTVPIFTLGAASTAPTTDPAGFTRVLTENFATTAPAGTGTGGFIPTYANSFQPYDDVAPYFPRQMISSHDGVMDVYMDGTKGAAGSFGSPSDYFNRVGGRFAMRAKALDAIGNGTAVMLWPSARLQSDGTTGERWADGEIDYPESNFDLSPYVHHHRMIVGSEGLSDDYLTGVSWRDWHVYSVEWYPPGKGPTPATGSVRYYVDEVLVMTVTTNIPTVAHRYMFQVGNYGTPGHMYIDWVTVSTLN